MSTLPSAIEQAAAGFNGRFALSALNLQTDQAFCLRADEVYPTASVIKLPVLLTLMQQVEDGLYDLDAPLMLRRADKIGGSGLLQHLTPGLTMPIRDWAFMMMSISDNLATNVLIDHVGLAAVNNWLDAHDYPDVRLHRKIDFGEIAKDQRNLGTASPDSLTRMITAVFRRQHISPTACDEMLRLMDGVGADRVGRYLPFSLYGSDEPEEQKLHLAGKTGSLMGMRAQTAVVWRGAWDAQQGFALTVMTAADPTPERWSADSPGVLLIGRIAKILYDNILGK
ncbi:MAG: serine hydrolase [Ardenticatenaceae bacterium]|nr:serine hydrolase [Ardenticatenaceae bacterium]MCB8986808.1 serine hydrolase [Ardenticatenaceae bacterium]